MLQRTVFINKIRMLQRTQKLRRTQRNIIYYGKFDYSFHLGKDCLRKSCASDCLCFQIYMYSV